MPAVSRNQRIAAAESASSLALRILKQRDGDRFWSHVRKGDSHECWPWNGVINNNGYGQFKVMIATNKPTLLAAHRVAWVLTHGILPFDTLDHLCRNRVCCNPLHLEAVSAVENVLRGNGLTAMQARQTQCKRGHLFDEANTIYHRRKCSGRLWRTCRICQNWRSKLWRQAKFNRSSVQSIIER